MTDPIVAAARFIDANLEWLRHRPNAGEALDAIERCARIVRGLARGPAEQRFLGPCGCELATELEPGITQITLCEGDVYAPRTASVGRCRVCGAEVSTAEREAWLDAQTRSHAFTARAIADAYGVNVKTIRTWADRGQLTEHGRDRDNWPLYLVGDVLDLFRALAVRRGEDEARRARRHTRTEGAAA